MDAIDLLQELTKVDTALAEAVRHHTSRDESNAALHMDGTVFYAPLTQALRDAYTATRQLLDGTPDGSNMIGFSQYMVMWKVASDRERAMLDRIEKGHEHLVVPAEEVEKLREVATANHRLTLLGQVLGRILVASGVTSDVPLTGPQLLMAAEEHAEWLESNGGVPDYVWRLLDALLNGVTLDFKGAVVPQALQERVAKYAAPLHEQAIPSTVGAHDASEVARIEQDGNHPDLGIVHDRTLD